MTYRPSRRTFLKKALATAAAPAIVPASVLGLGARTAPSDRIVMGCIGVGNQGGSNMRAFLSLPEVQVVAVCDVDAARRENARNTVNEAYSNAADYKGCDTANDWREIIARDDIDAVSIGTPDHWHALQAIAAAETGKDIYCEKPLSLTVADGRETVDTVHRYGRVLQTGTWRRSRPAVRRACELVRNGYIGELKAVHVGLPKGYQIRGDINLEHPILPVPEGFDYDLWLGPAPWAPYTPGRCHFNFRWLRDYSEGYISDWGAHYYDVAQWGMGTDRTGPVRVEGVATFPEDGLYDAAITHRFEFSYADTAAKLISFTTDDGKDWGMRFEGSAGWLYVESDRIMGEPESMLDAVIGPDEIRLYDSPNHHQNFVDCIRSRGETAAPVEIAHRSASVCHIGSICAILGRDLDWDPHAETFPSDPEANRLLARAPRLAWM